MGQTLLVDGTARDVEVVRYDVEGYTLRAIGDLSTGARVELIVSDNMPVPCVVEKIDDSSVRLRRGWGPRR